MKRRSIEKSFDCGDGQHKVLTLTSQPDDHLYAHRKKPCEQCPWRKDVLTGAFPASAYRHSATTTYDMARNTFACHMQGVDKAATCAGFLLRGADHNLSIRLARIGRRIDLSKVSDGGYPLYKSYRAMAIANGVAADDPALAPCRGVDEDWNYIRDSSR